MATYLSNFNEERLEVSIEDIIITDATDGVAVFDNEQFNTAVMGTNLQYTAGTKTLSTTSALTCTSLTSSTNQLLSGYTYTATNHAFLNPINQQLTTTSSPTFNGLLINNFGSIRPVTDGLADLGTPSLTWGNAYITSIWDCSSIESSGNQVTLNSSKATPVIAIGSFGSTTSSRLQFDGTSSSSQAIVFQDNNFDVASLTYSHSTNILTMLSQTASLTLRAPTATSDTLTLGTASDTATTLEMLGTTSSVQSILFSDTTSGQGTISYTHNTNLFAITSGTARFQLNRPGVNQSKAEVGVVGDTNTTLRLNCSASGIDELQFYGGGSQFALLQADALSSALIFSAGTGLLNLSSSGFLVQALLSPGVTATYDIGSTAVRWKDLWLSGSATMGALSITNLSVSGNLLTNLIPSPTNTLDLGSSTNIYNEVWSTTYRGDGTNLTLSPAGSGTAFLGTASSFSANVAGTVSLGLSSFRWSNVFTTLLNVSGTSTVNAISCTSITASSNIFIARTTLNDSYMTQILVDPGLSATICTFDIWDRIGGVDTVRARMLWSNSAQNFRVGLTARYILFESAQFYPNANNTIDWGTSSNNWKDTYSTRYMIGSNAVLSGSTLGSTITASSLTTLGNIAQALRPDTDSTRDLGTSSVYWRDGYIDNVHSATINSQQFSPSVGGVLSSAFGNFSTTTTNALVLYTTTTGTSLLSFSDNGTNGGSIAYSHSTDLLTLNSGAGNEAMRIDSSQRSLFGAGTLSTAYTVTINKASVSESCLMAYRRSNVAADTVIQCNSNSGSTDNPIFRVRVDGGLLSLPATLNLICDRRTKRDVTLVSDQDEDILFLADHMVNFYYTEDNTNTRYLGWVAQEIQEQCPGLVQGTGDYLPSETDPNVLSEKLSVKMSMIPVKATKCVAKLIRRVNELEANLQACLQRVRDLEDMMASL